MCFSQRQIAIYETIRPVFRRRQLLHRFEEVIFGSNFLRCFCLIANDYFRITLRWSGTVFAENSRIWLTHNRSSEFLRHLEIFVFKWLKIAIHITRQILRLLQMVFFPDSTTTCHALVSCHHRLLYLQLILRQSHCFVEIENSLPLQVCTPPTILPKNRSF